jgi:hypothetical protein
MLSSFLWNISITVFLIKAPELSPLEKGYNYNESRDEHYVSYWMKMNLTAVKLLKLPYLTHNIFSNCNI